MSCIIATHQFAPDKLDLRKNLTKMRGLVQESSVFGANIVVFPELSVSGPVDDPRIALECAQTLEGYQTQLMLEMAYLMNCYVCFGFIELYDGLLWNSYCVISPSGTIYSIKKKNLFGSDNLWASSDKLQINPVIPTPWGRVGCLIGRDIMNIDTENNQLYPHGSVDMILHPTNWVGDYSYPDSIWVDKSNQMGCPIIVSNIYGETSSCKYNGGICIITKDKIYKEGNVFNQDCRIVEKI